MEGRVVMATEDPEIESLFAEGGEWKDALKRAAQIYVDADDAIKAVNKDIKPLREQRTSSKDEVMGIMARQGLTRIKVHDMGVQFSLKTQRYKLPLNKERLRALSFRFFSGDRESAERLIAFLTEPEYEERVQLRRRKDDADA